MRNHIQITFKALLFFFALLGNSNGQGLVNRTSIGPFMGGTLPATTPPPIQTNGGAGYTLEKAFPNLTLPSNPIALIPVPNSTTDKMLLGEKSGKLFSFINNPAVSSIDELLDISEVTEGVADSGLLGITMHPQYGLGQNKDYIYVYYRYRPFNPGNIDQAYMRLSRFTWPLGSNTISRSSEQILINQYDPHNWHNGGGILFGPDGFLYLTVGDAGGADDEFNTAQRLDLGLFSGVLRIDVDQDPSKSHPIRRQPRDPGPRPSGFNPGSYSVHYSIPNDNPWQDPSGNRLEEFYAIGLRSPHRMTYDSLTNQFWIGDIGQVSREEISILSQSGANFQWPFREGNINGRRNRPQQVIGTEVAPYFSYNRSFGHCVIGGYVYRGSANPSLFGKYLFCEYSLGKVYAIDRNSASPTPIQIASVPPQQILSFGIDRHNEIYLLQGTSNNSQSPDILRLVQSSNDGDQPPPLLSATGVFSDLSTLSPATGVTPYNVIQQFWSDNASKRRWMAIPTGRRIAYSAEGNWLFPNGTVLIKHFEINGRHLETRFSVKGSDSEWYFLTYRWNNAQTDAELLSSVTGQTANYQINGRNFEWYYPSRGDCLLCHTPHKGRVLGLRSRHLNMNVVDYGTGQTINQLVGLSQGGYLNINLNTASVSNILTATAISDTSASLESRVRSYLDINCSQCHVAGNIPRANLIADMTVPLAAQRLIDEVPVTNLGIANARVVAPGDENRSVLYQRMNTVAGCCAMPPLARNEIDTEAVTVLREWIRSIQPATSKSFDLTPIHSLVPRTNAPITLLIPYTLDEPADLAVDIKNSSGQFLGGSRTTLNSGQGTASIAVNFNQIPPMGTGYRWDVFLTPVGGTYQNAFIIDNKSFEVIREEQDFQTWYQLLAPSDNSANPAIGDYDNDGINNFYEYAFAGNPTISDLATIIPRSIPQPNGNVNFLFRRPRFLMNYQVQTSTNLANPNGWVTRRINPGTAGGAVSFTINPNWERGGNKLYIRVIASQ